MVFNINLHHEIYAYAKWDRDIIFGPIMTPSSVSVQINVCSILSRYCLSRLFKNRIMLSWIFIYYVYQNFQINLNGFYSLVNKNKNFIDLDIYMLADYINVLVLLAVCYMVLFLIIFSSLIHSLINLIYLYKFDRNTLFMFQSIV